MPLAWRPENWFPRDFESMIFLLWDENFCKDNVREMWDATYPCNLSSVASKAATLGFIGLF